MEELLLMQADKGWRCKKSMICKDSSVAYINYSQKICQSGKYAKVLRFF